MTELKSFKNGVQWAWDSTSISTAMTCPRKYYYTMILKIGPKNKSIHLIFGGIYATALEHFYKHVFAGTSREEALLLVVREAMEACWKDGELIEAFREEPKKSYYNLIRTIVWYLSEFGDERGSLIKTLKLANGSPACELSFTLELDEDLVLCGHLDRMVTLNDEPYVLDNKTTGGAVGSYFFDGFKPDVQMSIYTIAGQVIFGSPVKGVIIDAAEIAVGHSRFTRGFTTRTKAELDETMEDVRNTIDQTIHYTEMEKFPRNLSACSNYGGCPFRPVCSVPPNIRDRVIAQDYVEKIWDPIERR